MAPCKINLSLRVLGRRDDGFHELDTLMAPLSLSDELLFEPSGTTLLTCSDPQVPSDDTNLVIKALNLFSEQTGKTVHYRISLTKNVPSGAGLGGGSSDAAATLVALNELEGTGLSRDELACMASALGSDVPFFLYGGICRCTGRGEEIRPETSWSGLRLPVVLLKPAFSVSTPFAYKRWACSAELPGIPYGVQQYAGVSFVNDLERPVFEKYLFLAEMKKWLLARPGVMAAMMSGSGSTMFAVLNSLDKASSVIDDARSALDPTLWAWSGWCGTMRE